MPPKKKIVSPTVVKKKDNDWRGGTLNMMDLVWNLHDKPEGKSMSDVTFLLDDETELQAHKLILATASPYFEALFYGPLANNNEPEQKVEIKDVDADCFGSSYRRSISLEDFTLMSKDRMTSSLT